MCKTENVSEEVKEPEYTIEFYISLLFHYKNYNTNLMNEVCFMYKDTNQEFMRYRN